MKVETIDNLIKVSIFDRISILKRCQLDLEEYCIGQYNEVKDKKTVEYNIQLKKLYKGATADNKNSTTKGGKTSQSGPQSTS